jgi:hypothetical protein
MEKGEDFLRSQVNNAVAQHHGFVESLKTHAADAVDPRFRALCEKYIPMMERHQGMLEQYQRSLGAGEGKLKKVVAGMLETGKEWLDASIGDDYLCLVGDIVLARQSEDTLKTFREGGRVLGDAALRRLGEEGEKGHDQYVEEAQALVQQFFVERVQIGAVVRP